MSEQFASIKSRSDYQSARCEIFSSTASLDWYIRRHRIHLTRSGALLVISGRLLVDEKLFDMVVIDIGRELAVKV